MRIVIGEDQVRLRRRARPQTTPPEIGYLLKQRVADLDRFFAALERIAAGGSVIDPDPTRHAPAPRLTRLEYPGGSMSMWQGLAPTAS